MKQRQVRLLFGDFNACNGSYRSAVSLHESERWYVRSPHACIILWVRDDVDNGHPCSMDDCYIGTKRDILHKDT